MLPAVLLLSSQGWVDGNGFLQPAIAIPREGRRGSALSEPPLERWNQPSSLHQSAGFGMATAPLLRQMALSPGYRPRIVLICLSTCHTGLHSLVMSDFFQPDCLPAFFHAGRRCFTGPPQKMRQCRASCPDCVARGDEKRIIHLPFVSPFIDFSIVELNLTGHAPDHHGAPPFRERRSGYLGVIAVTAAMFKLEREIWAARCR